MVGPGLARRTERCALTVGAEPHPLSHSKQPLAATGAAVASMCQWEDVMKVIVRITMCSLHHTHIRRRRTRTHQIQTNHTHKYKEPFKLCALWFGRENTVCVCVFFGRRRTTRRETNTHVRSQTGNVDNNATPSCFCAFSMRARVFVRVCHIVSRLPVVAHRKGCGTKRIWDGREHRISWEFRCSAHLLYRMV